MNNPLPLTIILRHRRENLKKCSLRGLEKRPDFRFLRYPCSPLISQPHPYLLLSLEGPPLQAEDASYGILLLDATWRYAAKMQNFVMAHWNLQLRSIPTGFITAYPRRQEDCSDPAAGLASIEALYIAFFLLGRDTTGLLENYCWREQFLNYNKAFLNWTE